MFYENEVTECLCKENYDLCLEYCEHGRLSIEDVEQIAQFLDPRIFGDLQRKMSSLRDQQKTRDCFRFVMSKWYNFAHEGDEKASQFNVFTLIEMLKNPNIEQFKLASELEKQNKKETDTHSSDRLSEESNERLERDWEVSSHSDRSEKANETLPRMHKISRCLTDDDLPVYGRRVPLNDILIEVVTYHMREKEFDGVLMTTFDAKIGKEKVVRQLRKKGVEDMDAIMTDILLAWRGEVDATEENLLRFLREFLEFRKCVMFLEDYIKQNRCLQRSQSDANLLDNFGDPGDRMSVTHDQPHAFLTKTHLKTNDFTKLVKHAKKEVKDYAVFTSFAKNLGVLTPEIEHAIRKMDRAGAFLTSWTYQTGVRPCSQSFFTGRG